MEFNLVIEIEEEQITEWLADNPTQTREDLKNQINNACYLGMDCTDAILARLLGFGVGNSYVRKG